MSLIRLGIVFVAVVALLPSDPNARNDLAIKAAHVGQETATFCTRNPATCAAGTELWDAFVQKAQYGLTLAAEFARSYADRKATGNTPSATGDRPLTPAGTPAPGTLQPGDRRDQWRQSAPRERI